MRLPTRVHGMLDYLLGALLIGAPWLFGFENGGAETWVPVALGAGVLLYSAFTDYELGLVKKLQMPAHLLWGLRATGRGIPRPGMAVLDPDGARVGEVTSGTFSPSLRTGIALALLDTASGVAEGSELAVDVRGRPQPVEVVRPPFVPSHVR